ncbi:hypothetical protein, partial [Kribbella sp. NPDC051718]|uniref:hypothetical protein n=1 Tax=Kribbella sp. NPDC051718 TaxID=3155168 RepID=UPI00341D3E3C
LGFFLPMDSMMNILPEQLLLIWDVRQNGAGSGFLLSWLISVSNIIDLLSAEFCRRPQGG